LGKNACHTAIAILLMTTAFSAVAAGDLRITSPSFEENAVMPPEFTCDGAGTSPALRFSGAPRGTRSLVLIVVDPDVPKSIKPDGRYLHWALWNLSASRTEIIEGQRALGLNENGPGGYIPPCPPSGEHRYLFQLYAIDFVIGNASISNEADLRNVMEGHILQQSELVGRYTVRSFRRTRNLVVAIAVLLALIVIYRLWLRLLAAVRWRKHATRGRRSGTGG
jgi:Raf kinase inhibitor-like YbhB/YbcL family protein